VALIGYKVMEDKREDLSGEYVSLAGNIADIGAAFHPNINDYYNKYFQGLIQPPDRKAMERTPVTLREVAGGIGIKEGTGPDARLKVTPKRETIKKKEKYIEYGCKVELFHVTPTEWKAFLEGALTKVSKYAVLESLTVERQERSFAKMDILAGAGSADPARWRVTVEFVWFGPLN
jgi:hypothetical protein